MAQSRSTPPSGSNQTRRKNGTACSSTESGKASRGLASVPVTLKGVSQTEWSAFLAGGILTLKNGVKLQRVSIGWSVGAMFPDGNKLFLYTRGYEKMPKSQGMQLLKDFVVYAAVHPRGLVAIAVAEGSYDWNTRNGCVTWRAIPRPKQTR